MAVALAACATPSADPAGRASGTMVSTEQQLDIKKGSIFNIPTQNSLARLLEALFVATGGVSVYSSLQKAGRFYPRSLRSVAHFFSRAHGTPDVYINYVRRYLLQ